MKTLHIALISPFFPLKGGISRFSGELRRALIEQGYRVTAISFRRLYPRFLLRGNPAYEPGAVPPKGRAGEDGGCRPLIDLPNPITWISAALRVRRMRPDIMICAYWTPLLVPLFVLLRRLTGIRMIVLMHNFSSHERFPGEGPLRKLLLSSADGVLALSRHVGGLVREASPSARVETLFHPLYPPSGDAVSREEARRLLGIRHQGPLLLFFGYVRRYKGLDMLLEAMPAVLRSHPEAMLAVAGEFHAGEKTFRDAVRRLDIADRVLFYPGFVPAERTPLFFRASNAVVLPYREASQSGVVQQAYGFGVPVIVTDTGGLAEAVRDGRTGVVVAGASPGAIASGIVRFLESARSIPYERHVADLAAELSWTPFADRIGAFAEERSG